MRGTGHFDLLGGFGLSATTLNCSPAHKIQRRRATCWAKPDILKNISDGPGELAIASVVRRVRILLQPS
jgi:hypothetical protein